jgi:zinc transport system ATP-binding protein
MIEAIIEAQNLSFSYGRNPVLEQVSFSVLKGDYVGIIGPNGGGKTTLLKILVGLLFPRSGRVLFNGRDFREFKDRSMIGYVPQRISQENMNFPATVYEVVESGRIPRHSLFRGLNDADREAINRALSAAGIENLKDRLVGSLSGGQRQRAYVARALAAEPEALILDEPFVGIDIPAQKNFYGFLKQLNENQGLTILIVSHDLDVIAGEVKSILCLNRGILCSGSPSALHDTAIMENLYGKKVTHIHG